MLSIFRAFGQDYPWPIDTVLTTNEQSFRETTYPQGLQGIAERLSVLRELVKQNLEDARRDTERVRNAKAVPHDFQIGQRVFVAQVLESSRIKRLAPFADFCWSLHYRGFAWVAVRLQHFYTGKL
jgi:hypothetical protein